MIEDNLKQEMNMMTQKRYELEEVLQAMKNKICDDNIVIRQMGTEIDNLTRE